MQIHCLVSFVSEICEVVVLSTTGEVICYFFTFLYVTS